MLIVNLKLDKLVQRKDNCVFYLLKIDMFILLVINLKEIFMGVKKKRYRNIVNLKSVFRMNCGYNFW